MSLESHLGASLHFFYFDVPKVMPLLLVLATFRRKIERLNRYGRRPAVVV